MPSSPGRALLGSGSVGEIHSLYELFFKGEKKKNRHHLPWIFTRSICLSGPCSPRRRSSESHGDWVAKTDLISFGALASAPLCRPWSRLHTPPSSPLLPLRVTHWLSSRAWSPAGSLLSWVPELLSAKAKNAALSALGSRHQHPHCPSTVGPCSRVGRPRGGEAESTFWQTSCLSLDRVHRRPGSGATGASRAFSFPPQLVTQGSSVQGLSNKLTIQSKHMLFRSLPSLRTLEGTGSRLETA